MRPIDNLEQMEEKLLQPGSDREVSDKAWIMTCTGESTSLAIAPCLFVKTSKGPGRMPLQRRCRPFGRMFQVPLASHGD